MGTKILNSRWFYVVLSILLAFLLWVYVGNDPNSVDTGTLRNVRVVFSGLEKLEERGLMISEGAEQTVNLQLSARGEVWSRLNQMSPVLPSQGSRVWLLPHATSIFPAPSP